MNNEIFGISCEIAIADFFELNLNPDYRERGDKNIEKKVLEILPEIFCEIPKPVKHIAEDQNPIDFLLVGNKTLSVKSNFKKLGKVAPQNIGQPTSKTFFDYFKDNIIIDVTKLDKEEKQKLFKEFVFENIDLLVSEYLENLFETDYYIHFFDLKNNNDQYNDKISYIILEKENLNFNLEKDGYSFTQSLNTWNESNTLKYKGKSIGEFQVHKKRDCFKFRFNIKNILNLND